MSAIDVLNSYLRNPSTIYRNIKFRTCVKPSLMPHIFIVGAPRSGTTLLQSILLVHEKIVGFDEETGFFMYRDLFSREFEGIKNDQYEKICLESSDIVSLYDGVAKLRIETIGRDGFFLEKTPQHVLKIDFLLKNFPNAKFLNLFRDIRDSAVSAGNFSGIPQGSDIRRFVSYWNRCVNARFNVNSKRVLDVFYEDMVKNPSVEISKIMSFLNLEYNNKQILPEYFSNNKRAGSDGFVKLKSAINDSSVGRFKSALSPETICVIESLAKDNLLKLGYL